MGTFAVQSNYNFLIYLVEGFKESEDDGQSCYRNANIPLATDDQWNQTLPNPRGILLDNDNDLTW